VQLYAGRQETAQSA